MFSFRYAVARRGFGRLPQSLEERYPLAGNQQGRTDPHTSEPGCDTDTCARPGRALSKVGKCGARKNRSEDRFLRAEDGECAKTKPYTKRAESGQEVADTNESRWGIACGILCLVVEKYSCRGREEVQERLYDVSAHRSEGTERTKR